MVIRTLSIVFFFGNLQVSMANIKDSSIKSIIKSVEKKYSVKCPLQPSNIRQTMFGYYNDGNFEHTYKCEGVLLYFHIVEAEGTYEQFLNCFNIVLPDSTGLIDMNLVKCK